MATEVTKDEAITRVVASARRLGVELDEDEAAEWVAAMETEASGGELVVNVESGVYGHRVTMLDFGPADLARFREMSKVVGFEDRPPQVLTALSISGSAAQSKINAYPADCDFFERIHIKADTREEACAILADLIREKALATAAGRPIDCGRSGSGRMRSRRRRAAARWALGRRCRGRSRRSGPGRWR